MYLYWHKCQKNVVAAAATAVTADADAVVAVAAVAAVTAVAAATAVSRNKIFTISSGRKIIKKICHPAY